MKKWGAVVGEVEVGEKDSMLLMNDFEVWQISITWIDRSVCFANIYKSHRVLEVLLNVRFEYLFGLDFPLLRMI